jgi:hypothetical protein
MSSKMHVRNFVEEYKYDPFRRFTGDLRRALKQRLFVVFMAGCLDSNLRNALQKGGANCLFVGIGKDTGDRIQKPHIIN